MSGRRSGPLALQLAAVMTAVALASVIVFGAIVYFVDDADVHHEANTRQKESVAALTTAALTAYREGGGWAGANLQPLASLAVADRLGYEVTSATGAVVSTKPAPQGADFTTDTVTLRQGDAAVGAITIASPRSPLPPESIALRNALSHSVFAAAGIAVAAAVAVALLLARRVTRPIKALSEAMRRHAAGAAPDQDPPTLGPGELGELAVAFHAMTVDLDDAARLRRGMVADLAHELRTPIAVLQAETEALLDGVKELTPAATASLHEEVLRLGRLVEDLQVLSSAEAAHLDLRARTIDLADLVASAVDAQTLAARTAGITLERHLTPVTVVADPLRLHQVVTNLLTNAIKYTPTGGRVHTTVGPEGNGAVVDVSDTGPGIPADVLPHVFERFRRGTHGEVPGSGVGLTVVRELVEAHGGTVEVVTPPTGGTRAVVHLPTRR